MSGLFGTLSIALSSLTASQQELATTSNNVANANTPGFSRQRPVVVTGDPIVEASLSFGTGVVLQKIVVDAGGVKPSYLGPPESFMLRPNN